MQFFDIYSVSGHETEQNVRVELVTIATADWEETQVQVLVDLPQVDLVSFMVEWLEFL